MTLILNALDSSLAHFTNPDKTLVLNMERDLWERESRPTEVFLNFN